MNTRTAILSVLAVSILLGAAAIAAEGSDAPGKSDAQPRVSLNEVLDAVGRASNRKFLVDEHVPAEIVVGQPRARDLDYAALLTILKNNRLAAAPDGDYITIVPGALIRQYALPIVSPDDTSVADDEWVTAVIEVENAVAAVFVPIVRPLLPQQGHLAAHPPSNTVIIVDRFGNLKRVAALIRELDAKSPPQAAQ